MSSLMYQLTVKYTKYINTIKTAGIINKYARLYATFQPREFYYETSDGESGTLINRFSKYISLNKCDYTDKTAYKIKYSSFYPVYKPEIYMKLLEGIDNHDMPKLLVWTSIYRSKSDLAMYTDVMNALDDECCKRLEKLNFKELAGIIHGFMFLIPNHITKLATFKASIPKLITEFEKNSNQKDLMQLLFFLGLWKKSKIGTDYMRNFVHTHMDKIISDDTSTMDFAILCSSTFKTSVKVSDQDFVKRLIKEIAAIKDDQALLINFVKCARMNRIKSPDITKKIKDVLLKEKLVLGFTGYIHLFAYFADNLIKDDQITNYFVEKCMQRIELEYKNAAGTTEKLRTKDLATFLWCCSHLNINLEDNYEMNNIAEVIYQKVDNDEYKYSPNELIESALSLWTLNYQSVDLVSTIFRNRDFMRVLNADRVRVESRKDLLLSIVEIEKPETFEIIKSMRKQDAFQKDRQSPDYLIKNRPDLQSVNSILESLGEKYSIKNVSYVVPVKYLNIAGILAEVDGQNVHIEVLDRSNSLSDGETSMGLFNMKLRILKKNDCDIILINANKDNDDVKAQLDAEFQRILGKNNKSTQLNSVKI